MSTLDSQSGASGGGSDRPKKTPPPLPWEKPKEPPPLPEHALAKKTIAEGPYWPTPCVNDSAPPLLELLASDDPRLFRQATYMAQLLGGLSKGEDYTVEACQMPLPGETRTIISPCVVSNPQSAKALFYTNSEPWDAEHIDSLRDWLREVEGSKEIHESIPVMVFAQHPTDAFSNQPRVFSFKHVKLLDWCDDWDGKCGQAEEVKDNPKPAEVIFERMKETSLFDIIPGAHVALWSKEHCSEEPEAYLMRRRMAATMWGGPQGVARIKSRLIDLFGQPHSVEQDGHTFSYVMKAKKGSSEVLFEVSDMNNEEVLIYWEFSLSTEQDRRDVEPAFWALVTG